MPPKPHQYNDLEVIDATCDILPSVVSAASLAHVFCWKCDMHLGTLSEKDTTVFVSLKVISLDMDPDDQKFHHRFDFYLDDYFEGTVTVLDGGVIVRYPFGYEAEYAIAPKFFSNIKDLLKRTDMWECPQCTRKKKLKVVSSDKTH